MVVIYHIADITDYLLSEKWEFENIGMLFTYSLITDGNDLPAFKKHLPVPEVLDKNRRKPMPMQQFQTRLQSMAIQYIRDFMMNQYNQDPTPFDNEDMIEIPDVEPDSLLGIISQKSFIDYALVGQGAHDGSKDYLERNPEGIGANFHNAREYNRIGRKLQELLR